ncbi:MAG: Xaa-Pro aminopeptidase [Desulfobacterales bacterium]
MFDPDVYRRRREDIRGRVGSGLLLFPGHEVSPVNFAANPYPFRQDSSFLYFFGIDAPGLWGLMDADRGSDLLFGEQAGPEDWIWAGPAPSLEEQADTCGVDVGGGKADLIRRVRSAQTAGSVLHFLPPYRGDQVLNLSAVTGLPPTGVVAGASGILADSVVSMRARKSPLEIGEIETALERTAVLFSDVACMLADGERLLQLAGAVDSRIRRWGARLAFPLIMTLRGEILHAETADAALAPPALLLADMGVESPIGYASDITRTFPVGGRFTPEQRDVYAVVLEAQRAAIGQMAPGVAFREVHLTAARVIAHGLREIGVLRGDPDRAVSEGAHTLFFPHGLGHLLGLDVHDMESIGEDRVGYDDEIRRDRRFGFSALRFGRRLQPGFVLTVEPGIYFIPALIDRWRKEGRHADVIDFEAVNRLSKLGGIRIEDDVLVTDQGCRVLGPPIPRAIDEVEAAVARRGPR